MKTTKSKKSLSNAATILGYVESLPFFSLEAVKATGVTPEYAKIVLHRLVKSKKVVPLKRGMYVAEAYVDMLGKTGKVNDYVEFLISTLYTPAYASAEYVLAGRGMLTEAAYAFTGITRNKTKRFSNRFGNFHYRHMKDGLFSGFDILKKNGFMIRKATMAKALFDFLYVRKNILSDKESVKELRLNVEMLRREEKREFNEYVRKEGSVKMKKIAEYLNLS